MEIFALFSILITLAALISYVNVRYLKLPGSIALMLVGAAISVKLILIGHFSPAFVVYVREKLAVIDFSEFILGILLSFLLFAGSLHVNFQRLKDSAGSIISFSTFSVVISTVLAGYVLHGLFLLFGYEMPLLYCFLFGALISPTDPIAVLGILKKAGISPSIEIKITGESLFNDGVGVVVFATILQAAAADATDVSALSVAGLFAREAFGGIAAGLLIGYTGFYFMRKVDHFQTEILITLAMVMGGYSLCHFLHVSGPLAMVAAGIFTGKRGLKEAVSDRTRDYLERFWEVLDEVLNSILFMLIGLQLVTMEIRADYLFIGLIAALSLLFIRYVSLWIPATLFRFKKTLEEKTILIMTWGGLRGGISIALALSMPAGPYKDVFVMVTYTVVLFSILVQGLTVDRLVKKLSS